MLLSTDKGNPSCLITDGSWYQGPTARKGMSTQVRRCFFHSNCETYSTQECELIAEWPRNKANMEMYSTMQSVVFSLLPPLSLTSKHWWQQSTFLCLPVLSNLPYPKPCVYKAAPCWSRWKASVHTVTGDPQQHVHWKLCYAGWRDKSRNSGAEKHWIYFSIVILVWLSVFSWNLYTLENVIFIKFLLILSQWQWSIGFLSQNVRSANKPERFPFHATVPLVLGEDWYQKKLKLRVDGLEDHITTICSSINPIEYLYYYLLLWQYFVSAKWGTAVLDFFVWMTGVSHFK